jgi:hypothetical protein
LGAAKDRATALPFRSSQQKFTFGRPADIDDD